MEKFAVLKFIDGKNLLFGNSQMEKICCFEVHRWKNLLFGNSQMEKICCLETHKWKNLLFGGASPLPIPFLSQFLSPPSHFRVPHRPTTGTEALLLQGFTALSYWNHWREGGSLSDFHREKSRPTNT